MAAESPPWLDETLEWQTKTTAATWQRLQDHGANERAPLQLDFFYEAPGESEALALAEFLRRETDYEVAAQSDDGHGGWTVIGSTQVTAVSSVILAQWVEWMVLAGAEHGRCRFDGWGAEVP